MALDVETFEKRETLKPIAQPRWFSDIDDRSRVYLTNRIAAGRTEFGALQQGGATLRAE